MYLKHFQLTREPFSQIPDPDVFFAGAGRAEVLRSLLDDLAAGKPLVKLTGSEGTGKSLLCLMLARKLSRTPCDLVFLDHPVGSFEDLLRQVCTVLGAETDSEEAVPGSCLALFKKQLQERGEAGRRVILIIDEAEKLFLATLERLVRLVCDTDEGDVLRILLSGRPDLEKNIDQLVIYCSNVDVHARYVLEPLTRAESGEYIHYRLRAAGALGDTCLAMFDREALSYIYQGAVGNIRLINRIAEKGLKLACEAGKFRVEAGLFEPAPPPGGNIAERLARTAEELNRYRLWLGSGVFALLVLVLFLLWPEQNRINPPEPVAEQVDAANEKRTPAPPFDVALTSVPGPSGTQLPGEDAPGSDGKQEGFPQIPAELSEVPAPEPFVHEEQALVSKSPLFEVSGPVAADAEPVPPAAVAEKDDRKHVPAGGGVEVVPESPEELAADEPEVPLPVQAEQVREEPEPGVVVLLPEARKKRKPEPMADLAVRESGIRDGDQIFAERMRASSSWLAWAYRGGYTIQLMVLASEDAEESLKALLVTDDYYACRDKLYILRKAASPTLLLFYGLFDTIEEARQARDSLPLFLRRNRPYALTINEALKKTDM